MIKIQFVYIDESGLPPKKDESKTFSLVSLIVDEKDWKSLFKEAVELRNKIAKIAGKENDEDFEIHLKDFVSKGKYHLSKEKNESVVDLITEFLVKNKERIQIISSIINKKNMDLEPNIEKLAISFLLERIHFNTRNYSLLIFDRGKNKQDKDKKKLIRNVLLEGTYYVKVFDKIIDDFSFVDSKECIFIQIVDSVAYILRNSLHNFLQYLKNKNIKIENDWHRKCIVALENIIDLFKKHNTEGTLFGCGLKIFPMRVDLELQNGVKPEEYYDKELELFLSLVNDEIL